MERTLSLDDLEVALKLNLNEKSRIDMMLEFSYLKNHEDRVGYGLKLLKDLNFVTDDVSVGVKSLTKSVEVRNKGIEAYKRRNFFSALKLYTEAIALAPHPSTLNDPDNEIRPNVEAQTALSLAIANRSELLFDLKKYDSCLKDLSFALEMNYPQNICHKLYARQMKCLHALGRTKEVNDTLEAALESLSLSDELDENDKKSLKCELESLAAKDCSTNNDQESQSVPNDDIKMDFKAHKSLRGFADCVRLKTSKDTGRGLFASEDIKIGDVIAIERPFAAVLGEEYFYTNCHNCCELCVTLIPCLHCSVAMFCSEDCCKEAWGKYHNVECEMLPGLLHSHIYTKKVALALRIVVIASNMFESLKDFHHLVNLFGKACEKQPHSPSRVKDFDNALCAVGKEEALDYFQIFKTLMYDERRSTEQSYFTTLHASSLVYFLEKKSYYFLEYNGMQKNKLMNFIGCLLTRHIHSFSHEVFSYKYRPNGHDFEIIPVGIGMYPVLNKINHSCNPNVFRYTCFGNKVVLRMLKDIYFGDEIFHSYGPLYYTDTNLERRNLLKRCFKITCHCTACIENWPVLKKLRKLPYRLRCQICGTELPNVKHSPYLRKCDFCHQTNDVKHLTPKLKDQMKALVEKSKVKGALHFSEIAQAMELVDRSVCKPCDLVVDCETYFKNYFYKTLCTDFY